MEFERIGSALSFSVEEEGGIRKGGTLQGRASSVELGKEEAETSSRRGDVGGDKSEGEGKAGGIQRGCGGRRISVKWGFQRTFFGWE